MQGFLLSLCRPLCGFSSRFLPFSGLQIPNSQYFCACKKFSFRVILGKIMKMLRTHITNVLCIHFNFCQISIYSKLGLFSDCCCKLLRAFCCCFSSSLFLFYCVFLCVCHWLALGACPVRILLLAALFTSCCL